MTDEPAWGGPHPAPLPHVYVRQILNTHTHRNAIAFIRSAAEESEKRGSTADKHYWWCCLYLMGEHP